MAVTVRLVRFPLVAGTLARCSIVHKLETACGGNLSNGLRLQQIRARRRVVWPDNIVDGAAGIIRGEWLVCIRRRLEQV